MAGETQISLLVVGKTGNGKSALCNTILGRDEFTTGHNMSSATTVTAQTAETVRQGITLKVVDTPDLSNLDMARQQKDNEVARWKDLTLPSPKAILLAVRCDVRYTAEEYGVYRQICQVLGDNFVQSRLVVVFTFGDRQDGDIRNELQTVCPELRIVLNDANWRYVVFNNRANGDRKALMVQELLERVQENENHVVDQILARIAWPFTILRNILSPLLVIWQWLWQRTFVASLEWVFPGLYAKFTHFCTQLVRLFLPQQLTVHDLFTGLYTQILRSFLPRQLTLHGLFTRLYTQLDRSFLPWLSTLPGLFHGLFKRLYTQLIRSFLAWLSTQLSGLFHCFFRWLCTQFRPFLPWLHVLLIPLAACCLVILAQLLPILKWFWQCTFGAFLDK